jgi:hypothetical protein
VSQCRGINFLVRNAFPCPCVRLASLDFLSQCLAIHHLIFSTLPHLLHLEGRIFSQNIKIAYFLE